MKDRLSKRVLFAVIYAPLFLAAAYFGQIFFAVFLAVLGALAFSEFLSLSHLKVTAVRKLFFIVGFFLVVFFLYKSDLWGAFLIFFLFSFLNAVFETVSGGVDQTLERFAYPIAGVILYGFFFFSGYLIRSRFYSFDDPLLPFILTAFPIITAWVTDTFAYFGGSWFGKHPLAEKLSPRKTVAGGISGMLGSLFVGFLAYLCCVDMEAAWTLILLGLIGGTAGQLGDLFESKLKREAGVKDSSHIFPGHGGAMDRIDSLVFIFPFFLAWYAVFLKL